MKLFPSFSSFLIRQIGTLVAVKSGALEKMAAKNFIYAPHLALEGEPALMSAIKRHQPSTLVIGANRVGEDVLTVWDSILPNESKLIIRRGTSTAAIDVAKAKKLGITVENTAHVNSIETDSI